MCCHCNIHFHGENVPSRILLCIVKHSFLQSYSLLLLTVLILWFLFLCRLILESLFVLWPSMWQTTPDVIGGMRNCRPWLVNWDYTVRDWQILLKLRCYRDSAVESMSRDLAATTSTRKRLFWAWRSKYCVPVHHAKKHILFLHILF